MNTIMNDWERGLIYFSPIGQLSFILAFVVEDWGAKIVIVAVSIYYFYLNKRYN
jgi:hypothetical protein